MAVYNYPEFKRASIKHLRACECLIESLKNGCKQKEKHILTTIYHLTGYIFETILKFSIYSAINFKKTENIQNLNSNEHNLTFNSNNGKRKLETHKLKELNKIFVEKHTERLDKKNFEKCKKLFYNWDANIRYDGCSKFRQSEIISFFEFAKNTYETLNKYK